MKRLLTVLGVLLTCAPVFDAAAEEEPSEDQVAHWRLETALRGRINRSGVGTKSSLSYRVPLGRSPHILLKGTRVEAGTELALSPASIDPAVFFRIIPISPILLGVSAQQLRWYGTFGNLSHFPGHRPDWSPEVLHGRSWKRNVGQYGTGYRLVAQAMLRLKLGPLVGLFDTHYKWIGAEIPPGASFVPATEDILVARRDRILTHKGDLLYFVRGGPNGPRFITAGLHWESHETRITQVRRQILGGIAGWRTSWGGPWRLTTAGIFGLYTVDPYRQGEPYVGVSLGLERTWTGD